MNQVRLPKVSVAVICLVVASVFHATPVLGAILTRQEFSGDFTLVDATSPFLTNSLPFESEYWGSAGIRIPDTVGEFPKQLN
ncbi:hypothetical protein [Nostoc sp.]|uniref:hypothetical protein n=1 Tax=Nostoc sp. TaxID=1180 RepID=UPI002FFC0340